MPADPVDPEVRIRIGELEETRASNFLSQWIDKRVAYHNSGLSLEERRLIEGLFREGVIRVLVTTSTLAAGVNMPADVVVMLDYKRYDFSQRTSLPIPVVEYKNSIGRAGRFGMSSEGHSYLVVDRANEVGLVRRHYLSGNTEQVGSAIPAVSDKGILVLGLLSLGLITVEDDLRDSIRHSFAYNHYFQDENERDLLLSQFMESIADLETNDLMRRLWRFYCYRPREGGIILWNVANQLLSTAQVSCRFDHERGPSFQSVAASLPTGGISIRPTL